MRQVKNTQLLKDDPRFRWRGRDVSRVEGFSDAVFGFAVTLLIVTLEVPRTFEALVRVAQGFPAFAVSFTYLFFLWYQHQLFFRRYGLNSYRIILLNGLLLFLVLFSVYPVKFLATLVVNGLFFNAFLGLEIPIAIERFSGSSYPYLYSLYALGFSALMTVFTLFYKEAWKLRDVYELNAYERFATLSSFYSYLFMALLPFAGILLVWVLPPGWGGHASGWLFFLIWPAALLIERILRRRFPEA